MHTRPHQSIPRNENNQSSIGSIERMGDDIMKELAIRRFKIQMRYRKKDFIVFWKFKKPRILETDCESCATRVKWSTRIALTLFPKESPKEGSL